MSENKMSFFADNVDRWGAAEWFDRLAKAVREQDKAVLANDWIAFETCKNIASSSALRLVRDYEVEVRDALATPTEGGAHEKGERRKRVKLPPIGDELYEHYAVMSAQTHEALVKEYARDAVRASLNAKQTNGRDE